MRVVFFIAAFFPQPTGATYSALRLATALREQGVNVQWIVDDLDGIYRRGGTYDAFRVMSFYLNRSGKLKKLRELFRFTKYLYVNRRKIDVFHVHGGGHMNILVAGWVKFFIPSIHVILKCTSDGWDTPDGVIKEKYGRLLLWIYKRLDGIVAMTSGKYAKLVEHQCRGQLAVIPNGTDCERYCPDPEIRKLKRKNLGISDHAYVLVYVGWLGQGKGTDVLFSVWHRLLERHPDLFLMTVGDYRKDRDADAELVALFNQTGLNPALLKHPQYIRIGHVEDAEHYLQAADIFIFPSRKEGFGTVQTEAMACGLPCVVNNLPGVSVDIYPDERYGFRVDKNDVDAYVKVVDQLLNDSVMRKQIGSAARQRVVECFSLESVGRRYVRFYKQVLRQAVV